MLLIEADGKALFAEYGIAVPRSVTAPRVMAGLTRPPTPRRSWSPSASGDAQRSGAAWPGQARPLTLATPPGPGPWMVKAQVPVGGRGKAGGVVRCATRPRLDTTLHRLLGSRLKGHQVDACLIEQAVTGEERYLALMVDAASYGVRVIYSAQGGVDIEQSGAGAGQICRARHGRHRRHRRAHGRARTAGLARRH